MDFRFLPVFGCRALHSVEFVRYINVSFGPVFIPDDVGEGVVVERDEKPTQRVISTRWVVGGSSSRRSGTRNPPNVSI